MELKAVGGGAQPLANFTLFPFSGRSGTQAGPGSSIHHGDGATPFYSPPKDNDRVGSLEFVAWRAGGRVRSQPRNASAELTVFQQPMNLLKSMYAEFHT